MRKEAIGTLLRGVLVTIVTTAGAVQEKAPDVSPFAASLIGHWRMDESAGQAAVDSAGKHTGNCQGGVGWGEGRFGGAASFNGHDSSIALGDLGSYAEATISFWMRPRNVEKEEYQGLVTTPSWSKGMLHLPMRKGHIDAFLHLGDTKRARTQSGPLSNARWAHVTVTISAITGSMVLYMDGIQVDQADTPDLEKIDLGNMTAGYEGEKRYFDGSLDEILILSRALSPHGVAYLAGKGGTLPPGDRLAGYSATKETQRAWQLRKGAAVEGALVKIRGKQAILRVGERELPVALSDLTEADVRYARYLTALSLAHADSARTRDWRNIRMGSPIPDEGYCDQPYVVVNSDGSWTCMLTTGKGHEGSLGQHIVATITRDQGKTWTPLVDIEPANGPEASWVVPLVVPSGRIYAFYTYNGDRINRLPGGEKKIRADMLGWYCYKYSDDGGLTWSKERYRIPVRSTACDRANQWKGDVRIFWGIDAPKISDSGVRFTFTKLGKYMLDLGEGWMMHSDNILTEPDVSKIRWNTLPDGEHGLRVPEFGSIQEEHNHVRIGDDRLYLVYRTKMGYPIQCYSDDDGRTWTTPAPMTYTPDGRRIKTPRACPKLWRCKNGKYLFWFHNHSGKTFFGRNPVWISGGEVRDGKMYWSEPEILLYHHDLKGRGMSYPDLIEQDGRYWVTETQKSIARIHEIPAVLLEGMWRQHDDTPAVAEGAVLSLSGKEIASGKTAAMPELPNLGLGGGFSIDVWLKIPDPAAGQSLLDTRDKEGCGFAISTGEKGSLVFTMNDGLHNTEWASDPATLTAGKLHHVVFIVDGGPCIISVVSDGVLGDGGADRQYGWGRFDPQFGNPAGGPLRITAALNKTVKHVKLYTRYLTTAEAVDNFRAGCPAVQ